MLHWQCLPCAVMLPLLPPERAVLPPHHPACCLPPRPAPPTAAVEEMAGMDILCSDKTGTLTLNKLTVDHVNCYPMSGHSIEEVGGWGGWVGCLLDICVQCSAVQRSAMGAVQC